jgi:hypothetical protein
VADRFIFVIHLVMMLILILHLGALVIGTLLPDFGKWYMGSAWPGHFSIPEHRRQARWSTIANTGGMLLLAAGLTIGRIDRGRGDEFDIVMVVGLVVLCLATVSIITSYRLNKALRAVVSTEEQSQPSQHSDEGLSTLVLVAAMTLLIGVGLLVVGLAITLWR